RLHLHSFPTRRSSDLEVSLGAGHVVSGRAVGLAAGERQPIVMAQPLHLYHQRHHTRVFASTCCSPNASATAGYTTFPSITLSPRSEEHTSELQSLAYL